ncbi:MAG: hypothetical protein IKW76_05920 [Clostridia bacterium]|nr:hypothetical protein [Clostridia bacterium]
MINKIPSTAEMKHYTAEEFCADMDAILDTITKEDTAYIIDTDKGQYVICPAHWYDILNIKRESNYLATYTVQYALTQNRETAELVCADIRRRLYTFSYGTVEKMIEDVTAFLKEHPDNEAAAAWSALVTDLQDEMTRIDTVTVEVSLDEQLLADAMAYAQARGITFQQLAETSIETLIREKPTLSDLQAIDPGSAPAASEPEKKAERNGI